MSSANYTSATFSCKVIGIRWEDQTIQSSRCRLLERRGKYARIKCSLNEDQKKGKTQRNKRQHAPPDGKKTPQNVGAPDAKPKVRYTRIYKQARLRSRKMRRQTTRPQMPTIKGVYLRSRRSHSDPFSYLIGWKSVLRMHNRPVPASSSAAPPLSFSREPSHRRHHSDEKAAL